MKEIFDATFSLINIVPATFLVFMLIYWIAVLVGLFDTSFLHFDIHADVDADIHVDTPLDSEINISSIGVITSVLRFFNLGKIPFMVYFSMFTIPFWVISLYSNYLLQNTSFLISLALLVPNILISLFIAKILTTPFVKVFTALDKEGKDEVIEGQICKVLMPVSPESIGQIEVMNHGAPILLNARTTEGNTLSKGETGLVINYDSEKECYIIEPYHEIL